MIDLTAIFGTNIKVHAQPRTVDRRYFGFAGANGLTAMFMGVRGHPLFIHGKLGVGGANYTAARAALQSGIYAIESYLWAYAADYTYLGTTYYSCVFEEFKLIPDDKNKVFHFTSEGYVTADFVCVLRSLY